MNKLKLLIILVISLLIIPKSGFALSEEIIDPYAGVEIISQEEKYYKVVTYYENCSNDISNLASCSSHSETYEITEMEYNNASTNFEDNYEIRSSAIVETTYKKMMSSIAQNGNYYRYINSLTWKVIPSVRSSDIIAIGFLPNVEPVSNPSFSITYSYVGGGSGSFALKLCNIFEKGVSCAFQMPAMSLGSINSINMHLYVDVKKVNTNSTITYQAAYADYAHATTATNLITASQEHVVNQSLGIVLNNSIINNYDTMYEAGATWYGSW